MSAPYGALEIKNGDVGGRNRLIGMQGGLKRPYVEAQNPAEREIRVSN